MDNHFSMEVRTNEKLSQLRKEGMASQQVHRLQGQPKWRLFFKELLSSIRAFGSEIDCKERVDEKTKELSLRHRFHNMVHFVNCWIRSVG